MFFWKKDRLVRAFARTLADDLYSFLDPAAVAAFFDVEIPSKETPQQATLADNRKKNRKKEEAHIREIKNRLGDVVLRVQQFRKEQQLGVYYKARLHQAFMGRLEELGYPVELVRKLNQFLLLQTP